MPASVYGFSTGFEALDRYYNAVFEIVETYYRAVAGANAGALISALKNTVPTINQLYASTQNLYSNQYFQDLYKSFDWAPYLKSNYFTLGNAPFDYKSILTKWGFSSSLGGGGNGGGSNGGGSNGGGGSGLSGIPGKPDSFSIDAVTGLAVSGFESGRDKLVLNRDLPLLRSLTMKVVVGSRKKLDKALAGPTQFVYWKTQGELFFNANGKLKGFGEGGLLVDLGPLTPLASTDLVLG